MADDTKSALLLAGSVKTLPGDKQATFLGTIFTGARLIDEILEYYTNYNLKHAWDAYVVQGSDRVLLVGKGPVKDTKATFQLSENVQSFIPAAARRMMTEATIPWVGLEDEVIQYRADLIMALQHDWEN